MATRNLTRKFLDARNGAKANKGLGLGAEDISNEASAANLLEAGDSSNTSNWQEIKNSLPPIWVDRVEQVEEDVSKIETKMKKLSGLHSKRLMVNFESDESEQEREIDGLTREITAIFRHAEGLLKRFGNQGDERKISKSERTVRNNMQRSIAKKLQGLSVSFRGTQKEYLARMKTQKSGGKVGNLDFLSSSKKASSSTNATDGGFNAMQMQELEDTEDLVNQRDEEIIRIAQSIEELAQIFKELAVLVIDQGTILDRIDYNMEQTLDHTKDGLVQLTKAEEYQKAGTPIKCIILLVFLNLIFLVILVVKHQGSKSN
jgi:syntaxin 16